MSGCSLQGRKDWKESLFEIVVVRSWWVFFFLLLFYLGFDQALKKKNQNIAQLHQRVYNLHQEKLLATEEQDDLLLRINSQNDSDWVAMVLMRELGLVPEGKVKVHFAKDS